MEEDEPVVETENDKANTDQVPDDEVEEVNEETDSVEEIEEVE